MTADRFRAPAPALHRASTVLFESVAHLAEVHASMREGDPTATMYGTFGTPTTQELARLVLAREGGAGLAFAPSGLAAVTLALLAVTRFGTHLLVPDSVYGPTRDFCDSVLARFGVRTTYYDPGVGGAIDQLLTADTAAVFVESPGSYTFEVQDLPAIVSAVRARNAGIHVVADNAWGSPGAFDPLGLGADISIVPLTKYWGGHADLLGGVVVAGSRSWDLVRSTAFSLGLCTNADEASLAIRGARTVDLRRQQHAASALSIARWLAGHPRVLRVLHPALPGSEGHELWKRDFTGSNGLLGIELAGADGRPATVDLAARFVDRLVTSGRFGLGYSWGGYESLVMPAVLPGGSNIVRSARTRVLDHLVRLHIGLEPVAELQRALEDALAVV